MEIPPLMTEIYKIVNWYAPLICKTFALLVEINVGQGIQERPNNLCGRQP